MPLTDRQIKNAKPADKAYKLADGGGLYLQVTPAGGKLWRLKYRVGGKEKLLSIGKYPLKAVELNLLCVKRMYCFVGDVPPDEAAEQI